MISGGPFRAARFIDRNKQTKAMKRFPTLFALSLISALTLSCACGAEVDGDPADDYNPDLSTLEGQWRDSVHTALSYAYQGEVLKIGQYRMPIWWKVYGYKPAGGRSLYISLHGGGQTDPSENDGQWENQKQLYTPSEGVYLCPRAITNTWDLLSVPSRTASTSRSSRWPSCSWT